MNTASLLSKYQRQIDSKYHILDKFKESFDKDPAYALSWGNEVFREAAELRVLKRIVVELQNDCTIDAIRSTLLNLVLNKSKYPPQSTSPTSNLIEQYELAAYANILSDLEY